MKSLIALTFRLSLIGFLPLAAAGQSTNAVVSIFSDTNAVKNFRVSFSFPKSTFTNGEPVTCLAGLTNVSEIPTIVVPSAVGMNLQFCVIDASGVPIPYSHLFRSTGPVPGPQLVPPHSVERGAFVLNDYFQLTPGSYQVSVVRDMRYPSIMLTSSVEAIKIVGSSAPAASNAPPPRGK